MREKKNLRGRIIAQCGSLQNFAEQVKMSYRKVSYIVNGKQEATASDIEKICNALNVKIPDEIVSLFFL